MSRLYITIFVALIFLSSGCTGHNRKQKVESSASEWRKVSSFTFDWDHGGKALASLEIPKQWDDPGDFTRLCIRMHASNSEFTLNDKNGWVKYRSDDSSLSKELHLSNQVHSEYVLALRANESRTVLFLFGFSYAGFGSFDAIELSEKTQPRVVLHLDEFALHEFRDLNGDGLAELIGKPCVAQGWGKNLLTYSPFNVYELSKMNSGPAELSLPLSKSYSLEHYYGWSGAACSEDVAVVLDPPKGGKPVIVGAKEAQQMEEFNR